MRIHFLNHMGNPVFNPKKQTSGSAGYDLRCAETSPGGMHTIQILPGETKLIDTGITVGADRTCTDEGAAWFLLAIRSSIAKYGLSLANAPGVIDLDYCGPDDRIKVMVFNRTNEILYLDYEQRFAQLIPIGISEIESVEYHYSREEWPLQSNRGGFGSTGSI